MRILAILCQNPFTHSDGGTYAVRASLRHLAAKGELFVAGFGADFAQPLVGGYRSAGTLGEIRNSRLGFVKTFALGRSYSMEKYAGAQAQRELGRILRTHRFAVVWFDKLQAAAAALRSGLLESAEGNRLHVLRAHNVEHAMFKDRFRVKGPIANRMLCIEQVRLKRDEFATVAKMDYTFTISREDRDAFIAEMPSFASRVVFLPLMAERARNGERQNMPRSTVLFVGDCRWRPNLLAAEWISAMLAPELHRQCPDLSIRLVGRDTEAVRALQTNLQCVGFVDNIDKEYETALCTLAPVWHGGGVNVKVIESPEHSVPVVGSAFGRRGTDTEAYLEAENVSDFVARIRDLRNRPEWVKELAVVARKTTTDAEDRFDGIWDHII
jgi:polysaccharide biosynthesis protein PslH